jgi:hypothetical protein
MSVGAINPAVAAKREKGISSLLGDFTLARLPEGIHGAREKPGG